MIIQTTRFGEMEIEEGKVITFPEGVPGFWEVKEFILLDHAADSPLRWLQAVREPGLAFVVTDPLLFKPDYRVSIRPEEVESLKAREVQDLLLLAIMTIPPGEPEKMTLNLKGPVVINPENRLAKQLVLDDVVYPTRFPLTEFISRKTPEVEMETSEVR